MLSKTWIWSCSKMTQKSPVLNSSTRSVSLCHPGIFPSIVHFSQFWHSFRKIAENVNSVRMSCSLQPYTTFQNLKLQLFRFLKVAILSISPPKAAHALDSRQVVHSQCLFSDFQCFQLQILGFILFLLSGIYFGKIAFVHNPGAAIGSLLSCVASLPRLLPICSAASCKLQRGCSL